MKNWKWWHWALAGLVLWILIMSLRAHRVQPPQAPPHASCERFDALYYARADIEQRLKAPKTADFQAYHEAHFEWDPNEPGVGLVKSYVDAENSFGAMIRTHYVCELTCSNGKWVRISCVTASD